MSRKFLLNIIYRKDMFSQGKYIVVNMYKCKDIANGFFFIPYLISKLCSKKQKRILTDLQNQIPICDKNR